MRKEELLKELQELVLELHNQREYFLMHPANIGRWRGIQKQISSEIDNLSDADKAWVNSAYSAWFKKHILPQHKELAQKILDNPYELPS